MIVVQKSKRLLELHQEDGSVLSMQIALGREPLGTKRMEGDGKTPEGDYYVCTKNPNSQYHLALGLSYPNAEDARYAQARGLISPSEGGQILSAMERGKRPPWDTPLGGFIMIHGGGTEGDWTQGCIALSNKDIETLWTVCALGTKVRILA